MILRAITTALYFILLCNSCITSNKKSGDNKTKKDSAAAVVEIYDSSYKNIINNNALIEVIAKGYDWSEGPVWVAAKQTLLFSDVPQNKIYEWKEGDTAKVYLTPSGYTANAKKEGEIGSNGLTLDAKSKLILCQSGDRVVAAMNSAIDDAKAMYTALAANYNGKKLNSPNDVVTDSRNNIYFTDPVYGLANGENDTARQLSFEGLYKINPAGKTTLLIDSVPRPNGVALSLDEKILYLASSDDIKPRWYAYNLNNDGNIKSGGILLDALPLKEKALVKQGPDGLKIDNQGNLFAAGPDGINIITPQGKLVALIKVFNRKTSNCAFNETKSVLYVTADDEVLKVTLHP